jgi:hypothetical protein
MKHYIVSATTFYTLKDAEKFLDKLRIHDRLNLKTRVYQVDDKTNKIYIPKIKLEKE